MSPNNSADGPTPSSRLLWTPSPKHIHDSRMYDFGRWASERHGVDLIDYDALWNWSVQDVGQFWADLAQYFGVVDDCSSTGALPVSSMPGSVWFPGVEVNLVESLLSAMDDADPAIVFVREGRPGQNISARELRSAVAGFAQTLLEHGVRAGDRVAGYLPNTPHAVIAFLGTASIGAVWTMCAPDFGPAAALERIAQTTPTVLVAGDGYTFGGVDRERRAESLAILKELPTITTCVWVDYIHPGEVPHEAIAWEEAICAQPGVAARSRRFADPLWILFSSGTTGVPKGILHSHGGILLESLKSLGLHGNLRPGDRFYWYTTTAWMLWNTVVLSMLTGATAVIYDGSPLYPDPLAQWRLAADHRVTYFGMSAGYLTACAQEGLVPSAELDLTSLSTVGSTGSPLPAATAAWVCDAVGGDVQVASSAGGTDVATAFVGAAPLLPVYAGEMSGPMLGVAVEAWDEKGRPARGSEGELVVTAPMPSMPLRFWGDLDNSRYTDAYFSTYPGVWRHGDWLEVTTRGTMIVSGRSDSTLNRGGVRMGTADVYAAVDTIAEIADCIMLGIEMRDGSYWMPLFVVPMQDVKLNDALRSRIHLTIATHATKRHVPDDVLEVSAIPRTKTGKRLEVPLKRIFQGIPIESALNKGSVANPEALDDFVALARERTIVSGAADLSG